MKLGMHEMKAHSRHSVVVYNNCFKATLIISCSCCKYIPITEVDSKNNSYSDNERVNTELFAM